MKHVLCALAISIWLYLSPDARSCGTPFTSPPPFITTLHPKTIVYFFPWQPYQDGKASKAALLAKRNAENSESGTLDSDLVHANC